MKYIVRITDSGPLSFRAGRETTSGETLRYVSGSVLFGALATTYTKLRHDETLSFNEIFFSDESSFGNLYPSSFSHAGLARDRDAVYPLPNTASTCKRFGGFQFDEEDADDPHHGVYDTLISWALFALSDKSEVKVFKDVEKCFRCGESMDRIDGFYRRNARDAQKMGTASIKRSLRTRTGINRATGTVQQGILYSREVLRPGMEFWGTVTVPDAQAKTFKKFVEEASQSGMLRLGNNKTRGFGRVILNLKPAQERGELDSLRQRLQTFDRELRQAAQKFNIETPHKLYLPLTLTADAILFDRLLRYRTALDKEYLQTQGISGAELIYQNSGTRQVMGWNTLLGVPKADEMAITMGSVFLFGLESELDDNLLQTLLRMQTEGIGARRSEGFGRLLVASRFHWEVKGT